MKILITGINGFVGQHLTRYLLKQSEVTVFGLDTCIRSKNAISTEPEVGLDKVVVYETDLMIPEQVNRTIATIQPDGIFHLAARTSVPESYTDQPTTLLTNIIGTVNLLNAVRHTTQAKCRVVIACSSDQYGRVDPQELPIKEIQPFRPLTPYAVSKIGQEMVAYQYYLSYGLPTIRIRAFNHTGPGQRPDFVCPSFANQIAAIERNEQTARIQVGNLDTRRDFTDVRDMVAAYWLAITQGVPGEVYNICSGQSYSMREILNKLLACSSAKIEIVPDPNRTRPVDVPILEGDYTKFKSQTKWEPRIPFDQTLQDLLNYYRQNRNTSS
ncbi:MAG: GDP-mannose 4,6-dehydratase [bacterium]